MNKWKHKARVVTWFFFLTLASTFYFVLLQTHFNSSSESAHTIWDLNFIPHSIKKRIKLVQISLVYVFWPFFVKPCWLLVSYQFEDGRKIILKVRVEFFVIFDWRKWISYDGKFLKINFKSFPKLRIHDWKTGMTSTWEKEQKSSPQWIVKTLKTVSKVPSTRRLLVSLHDETF